MGTARTRSLEERTKPRASADSTDARDREAWRGGVRSARIARLLDACVVEPLFADLARLAGEALGKVKGATAVDAVVMASAARRGDRVLTSDIDALDRLRLFFPTIRLLRV